MKSKQFTLLLFATIFFMACKKKEDDATPPSLLGTWAQNDWKISFINAKDYQMEGSGVTYERGTYTSTSTTFNLNNTSSMGCGSNETNATYNYVITGNTITCTSVDDKCDFRRAVFASAFTKK